MACLVGCIDTFSCGSLVTTVPTDNPAPWVKARFGKGVGGIMTDEIITVGNESCQIKDSRYGEKHHAAIKSMEYGTVDGHKCKLEIIDEEGGAFFHFFRRILKCLDRTSIEYQFQVQWGWTGTDCNGFTYAEASPIITFVPINIEVSFSDGVVKYNITGTDAFAVSFVAREDENTGRDDTRVCLQDAIEDIMIKNEPKAKVQFLRKEPSGAITTWKYKPLGPCYDRGPKCAWTYDNQNKMGTVSRWTEPFRTDRDKGVLFQWDNIPSSPTVTMWEDNEIECDERPSCGANHIGTFIVNGGKCSNVISFNPNINWPTGFAAMAKGGGAGATQNSEGKKKDNERPKGCAPQGGSQAGLMQSIPHTRQGTDYYGTDKNTKQTEKSQMAHNKANINREGIQPIEAELRIQGHPGHKFVDAWDIHAAYAAIVVINPFNLAGPWWDGCGDWQVLADSGCNTVLSNKYWKVMGVNHQIKEGSYVTTLKCVLPVPGVDISEGQPLGGDPDAFNPSEGPAVPC